MQSKTICANRFGLLRSAWAFSPAVLPGERDSLVDAIGAHVRLGTTAAAIALTAIGALALSGCEYGSRGSASLVQPPEETLTATPEAVGELESASWNLPYGEPMSLDPIKGFNYPENQVAVNLCETLVQMQPDLSIEPNLATAWEQVDDTTYVYQIRDDVSFWDGSPMTMDDVVYSVSRNLDPDEGSFWAGAAQNIASVEQTGEWELTIGLEEPDSVFTESLGTPIGAVVSQEHREQVGENFGNPEGGVMCTGPFTVGQWNQGQSIVLERNDDYWNEERRAKTEQFEINFTVDPTAIGNALSTGEVQGGYDVPLPSLAQLASSPTGDLAFGKSLQIMAVIPTGDGPFGDPAVRRAITRATDREAIAQTVFENTAQESASVAPEDAWDIYSDEVREERARQLPDLSYDLEAAKQELEAAEVDLSQPIKIVYPSERTFYADILNEMANGAEQIGLDLQPTGVPSAQFGAFFSDPAAREGYDGFVTMNYLNSPSPVTHLASIAQTGGDQNYSGFSDPEIDSALERASAERDEERRGMLTADAEALIMEQQPWVPIADLYTRLFMDQSVTGVPASFVYLYYPWAADLGAAEAAE